MPVVNFFHSWPRPSSHHQGITFIEILLVLAVLGVIAATAVPSFIDAIARARVKSATENIHGLLQLARTESPVRDANLSVTINSGKSCVGVASFINCDCTVESGDSACALDVAGQSVTQRVAGDELKGVAIAETFPGVSSTFNRLRGTASPSGTITISSGGRSLEIRLGLAGRIRICSPDSSPMAGYPAC